MLKFECKQQRRLLFILLVDAVILFCNALSLYPSCESFFYLIFQINGKIFYGAGRSLIPCHQKQVVACTCIFQTDSFLSICNLSYYEM